MNGMIKIFPIYYRGAQAPEYRSDVFEPMMAGDDPHWAELTVHARILSEWLPAHPEATYVGFCHYRRFPDFWRRRPSVYLPHVGFRRFAKGFAARYTAARILPVIDGYDAIVPMPARWDRRVASNYEQYVNAGHPRRELDLLIGIVRRDYPEMVPDLEAYLGDRRAYLWLQFVLRRDWFAEYLRWELDILHKLARQCDWNGPGYDTYETSRVPAYLAERFFNVFLRHKLRVSGGRLLERQCVFLVDDRETGLVATVRRYALFFRDLVKARLSL